MTLELLKLTGEEAWARRDKVGEIYRRAFGATDEQVEQFVSVSFAHVREYEGAVLLLAVHDDKPVGLLYGYTYKPDQWWSMQVGASIINAGYARYLDDAFSLAELAVLPGHQGKGIGSAMVRDLLKNQPQQYTLLSVDADPANGATRFYERHGFSVIVSLFRYSETTAAVHIMAATREVDSTKR